MVFLRVILIYVQSTKEKEYQRSNLKEAFPSIGLMWPNVDIDTAE